MKYSISVKKQFRYIKTYKVIKRVNDQSNAISRFISGLLDKYVVKSGEKGT
jgi:hypothetical protein